MNYTPAKSTGHWQAPACLPPTPHQPILWKSAPIFPGSGNVREMNLKWQAREIGAAENIYSATLNITIKWIIWLRRGKYMSYGPPLNIDNSHNTSSADPEITSAS